ncbi:MAG: UDP-N-acetylmuramate--L-alanine ligase, partial [bacterium]|nr:UDP-N-acetylmuramate--L-alanine ligase [bacterium]
MTKKLSSPSAPRAHFIGIGGIGISALARWFRAENWIVTGSDCASSMITDSLKKDGISVKIGHSRANLPRKPLNMVIYSPAIPKSNPELVEARRRGIKPLSYPEALGCLTRVYKTIAISGTHGKSTTTGMAAIALTGKGFDPNVVVGTNLKEFGNKNFRKGSGKWLIIEADEWKASFLNYSPIITVVTCIDKDHLDFYKNLVDIKKTFLKFFERTQEGGVLILNKEDKNLISMKSAIQKIAKKRDLEVAWYPLKNQKSKIKNQSLSKILKVPGKHNVSNAAAVLKIAETIGIKKSSVLKGLSRYKGAWRRMEYRGKIKNQKSKIKILVYDDYAHHPTEIKATLQAFREKFPREKLICVYQPHQTKRLKSLFKEFISAFGGADVLVLLPVYEVSGRDIHIRGYDSPALAKAIKKK